MSLDDDVLAHLRSAPAAMRSFDIARTLNRNDATIRQALARLATQGLVRCVGATSGAFKDGGGTFYRATPEGDLRAEVVSPAEEGGRPDGVEDPHSWSRANEGTRVCVHCGRVEEKTHPARSIATYRGGIAPKFLVSFPGACVPVVDGGQGRHGAALVESAIACALIVLALFASVALR